MVLDEPEGVLSFLLQNDHSSWDENQPSWGRFLSVILKASILGNSSLGCEMCWPQSQSIGRRNGRWHWFMVQHTGQCTTKVTRNYQSLFANHLKKLCSAPLCNLCGVADINCCCKVQGLLQNIDFMDAYWKHRIMAPRRNSLQMPSKKTASFESLWWTTWA